MKKSRIFILLLILTPGFWWLLLRPVEVFTELSRAPQYFSQRLQNVYSEDRLAKIRTVRWANRDQKTSTQVMSRLFYNKGTILVDEFFSFTSFLSPRFYFQAGDGSNLSPPGVEPIPFILLPLFIWGIVLSLKRHKHIYLLAMFLLAFLAFLFGQRNMAFLWPVLVMAVYFSTQGVEAIKKPENRKAVMFVLSAYCLYLGGRVLWLLN